jgi:TonB family protein
MMGLIRTDGHVAPICIKSSEGATPAMNSAALRALAQWRYAPALRNGQPVAVRFVVAISFSVR